MPNRLVLIAASCLAGFAPAFAQVWSHVVITNPGCPIVFSASREGAVIARAGQSSGPEIHPPNSGVRVNVHFGKEAVARILEVKGSVYGTTAAPHVELLNADTIDSSGPSARRQGFDFTGFSTYTSAADWKLDVTSVPVIQGISLSEIRLSDGTVWHESPTAHCRVAVSGLLLVGGSR